jgi:hypothetical protein
VYSALESSSPKHAVGITEGYAPCDQDTARSKQRREAEFPLALANQALSIELQSADASVPDDKRHILNAMIGSADFDAPLPPTHPRYGELNETLRARFAAGSLRAAFECSRDEVRQRFLDALVQRGACTNFRSTLRVAIVSTRLPR